MRFYNKIASQCERVHATNEGNVVPWLVTIKVLVHNCGTTGIEAYAMRVSAVSYQAAAS